MVANLPGGEVTVSQRTAWRMTTRGQRPGLCTLLTKTLFLVMCLFISVPDPFNYCVRKIKKVRMSVDVGRDTHTHVR